MATTLTAVTAAAGCGSSGLPTASGVDLKQLAAMPDVPGAMVQMRRGGCAVEPCPVYSVSIFMDGTVVYDGRANVATIGSRRAKLSPDKVSDLVTAIDAMRFLDSAERCCVCPPDQTYRSQMIIVDYRPGSAQKTVLHDGGCHSAPPAMSALEETIDRLANVSRWTAATPGSVVAGADSAPDHLR